MLLMVGERERESESERALYVIPLNVVFRLAERHRPVTSDGRMTAFDRHSNTPIH